MSYTDDLYIYDLGETDFTHNGFPINDFWEEPEINRQINGRYAMTGMYMKEGQLSELIVKDAVIRAKVPDRTWQLFRISSIKDDGDFIQFTARFKGLDVNRNFIEKMFASNQTVTSIMRMIGESLEFKQNYQFLSNIGSQHQFTIKQNHPIDAIIGENSGNQNLISVVGGELDMYGNTFYLKEQLGNDNGFRIDFGINLEAITEIISEEEPPNTLYLIGATPEGDYDQEREPIVLKYLEAPGIVITDENRVIATFTNENCKTVAELKTWADEELFGKQQVHIQKSAHEISLVDLANTLEYQDYLAYVQLQLGDVIYGTLQRNGKKVTERVVEYTWYPRLNEYKKIGTGSTVEYYTEKAESKINTILKKVDRNTDFLKESIINATELITGNDKGHIMFWPKNRPRELRIMDTDDSNTAKYVWRFNLAGLGHSSNGVDGPFPLAITQDGKIVADYILAGVLRAIDIIGVNIIGSTITGAEIIGSVIKSTGPYNTQAVMNGGKFAFEVTETGEEISKLSDGSGILTLERLRKNGGFNDLLSFSDDLALLMHQTLFEVNAPITKLQKLEASSAVIDGRLDVEELYVNGVKIDKNGGGTGGGGNGGNIGNREEYARNMITAEFGVDYNKMYASWVNFGRVKAWGINNRSAFDELNNILRQNGVSPVFFWAYEGGEGYHPDLSFLNHFYTNGTSYQEECRRTAAWVKATSNTNGNLAWYDAQYPYYTSPPDKQAIGNAYMETTTNGMIARVMLQGTAAATWAMFDPNGLKKDYNQVQDYSDPFAHQISLIKSWQVELKYIRPMARYQVTSEFGWREAPIGGGQEFHNAIDLATAGGGEPILASAAGEIVQAGNQYYDWYGNYVVIRHADGLYTGYAHLSSITVNQGQQVSQGQVLGYEGATGPVTGPHLHFQFMRKFWPEGNGDFINPREYINF